MSAMLLFATLIVSAAVLAWAISGARWVSTQLEHYAVAEGLLAEGVDTVRKIRALADRRRLLLEECEDRTDLELAQEPFADLTRMMDEHGKKVMGLWAQAQVHATLATIPTAGDR